MLLSVTWFLPVPQVSVPGKGSWDQQTPLDSQGTGGVLPAWADQISLAAPALPKIYFRDGDMMAAWTQASIALIVAARGGQETR